MRPAAIVLKDLALLGNSCANHARKELWHLVTCDIEIAWRKMGEAEGSSGRVFAEIRLSPPELPVMLLILFAKMAHHPGWLPYVNPVQRPGAGIGGQR